MPTAACRSRPPVPETINGSPRRRDSVSRPSLRGAQRRSNPFFLYAARWIASRSLSSGAHSRDPLARNDDKSRHTFATSPRDAPEALLYLPPKEGVGNAGCPWHPRPRVHFVVVERTRVTTSTPESPGVPARNGFTAYFELSPATGSFATVTCGLDVASAPGRADTTSATLTPAPRRQHHTNS